MNIFCKEQWLAGLKAAVVSKAIIIICYSMSSSSIAIELLEEDSAGNINQRNLGSYKSNSFGAVGVSGASIKRIQPLQPYKTLRVDIPVELHYFETGQARVELEGAQQDIDKINFRYNGNRLTIRSNGFTTTAPIKLTLYGNNLQRVFINGAADVELNDISVNDFSLSVRGAADVRVQGKARGCKINVQGASDLDLAQMTCQAVSLAMQGSADITLFAAKSLKGQVQGAGNVEVFGKPNQRKLQALGAYDVEYR